MASNTSTTDPIKEALREIATLMTDAIRVEMAAKGLDNSRLQQSIETTVKLPDTLVAYMAEYGQWVVSGRRKFAKRVPIAALLEWIQRKAIKSSNPRYSANNLAWAIQSSIWKNGIASKDFVGPALDEEFLNQAETILLDAMERAVEQMFASA